MYERAIKWAAICFVLNIFFITLFKFRCTSFYLLGWRKNSVKNKNFLNCWLLYVTNLTFSDGVPKEQIVNASGQMEVTLGAGLEMVEELYHLGEAHPGELSYFSLHQQESFVTPAGWFRHLTRLPCGHLSLEKTQGKTHLREAAEMSWRVSQHKKMAGLPHLVYWYPLVNNLLVWRIISMVTYW